MSLIIDGMDQQKTTVPHFLNLSKTASASWRLRTHLTGVILHGIESFAFFDVFEFPNDSNLTCNILLKILELHKESLPPVLYVQMDNCAGQNKNRYVLAFLSLLVELGIFKKVKVSFLMVGHTHEDVDQFFSRISSWLSKHNVPTLDALMKGVEKCFRKAGTNTTSIQLDQMYDITGMLQPYLEQMKFHSKPHVFKITQNEAGKAVMVTKKWSTDETWQSCSGDANGSLLKSTPNEVPKLIKPCYDNMDFHRLSASMESMFPFMSKESDKVEWRKFLDDMEQKINGKLNE